MTQRPSNPTRTITIWSLLTQLGPALMLFAGVYWASDGLMTFGTLCLFGGMMLNFVAYGVRDVVIKSMIDMRYTPSFPNGMMLLFDLLGVAALFYANYPVGAFLYAISRALGWTIYGQYLKVKDGDNDSKAKDPSSS